MIIATAGHIDHGKTALVTALTGVDADRLPEEKRRGITVDLGFAYHPLPGGGTLAFVDVPGHEKLVRTMLAGAVGVDFAMLVVAADDGVMPQTREHLAILDLLGLGRGLVALTKSDKVTPERIGAVSATIRALLQPTPLAHAPILPVSARTGEGVAALRDALCEAATATRPRADGKPFRFAVDRAFTLPGAGLVVTGTIHAGQVAPGDQLLLHAAGTATPRTLRIRDIHVANSRATGAAAGQRCALNITGSRLEKSTVTRGDWIVAAPEPLPSERMDVQLRLLPGEARPLRHWTPVHVHLGCADIPGRVVLLEGAALSPGESALGQLVLDRATSVVFGDRFVLRDQSAQRTLGGGYVIEPQPPTRGARRPDRLARLRAADHPDDAAALQALLAFGHGPVDSGRFAAARNLAPQRLAIIANDLGAVTIACAGRPTLLAEVSWAALRETTAAILAAWLDQRPEAFGATAAEIARGESVARRPLIKAALDALCEDGIILRVGQLFRPPGHVVELTAGERQRWEIVLAMLREAGRDPPRLATIAAQLGEVEEACRPLLEKVGRIGWLKRIGRQYFVLPDVLAELALAAARCAEAHPEALLTVGRFREDAGISRHATMPVLEFFDRVGLTSRHAEGRRLRMTAHEFAVAVGAPQADTHLSNAGG